MQKIYVQYGCGLSAPKEWINFDVSPTLRIQKTPLIGDLLKSKLNTTFPSNVLYGDIIKGLPIADDSCDGLYCSHTLEHLSLDDFRTALRNSYKVLKKGGIFRCVVPDLEYSARLYVSMLDKGQKTASMDFMNETLLGIKQRPTGVKGFISSFLGNSHHLWMWDKQSLAEELSRAGFVNVRPCGFNDCEDEMFKHVEDPSRFEKAAALECRK
ncbi:MAG: methyltransferase domain-containing protein [Spirosomaceae bacterium]|jgi:SAM-dependent methyltransferase|nr:methyltransferase domain-containing protein [Spirosomataceae bacterium]